MAQTYRSPWMDDELEMVRDAARRFFENEAVPQEERWAEQHGVDRRFWLKMGEMGFLGGGIPEAYGGGGGSFAHEAVVIEEAMRASAIGVAVGYLVHSSICAHYVLACGTEAQKRRWLPKATSGDWLMAIAMTEPGTGSDLQSVKTRAVRDGDDYILNGAKTFITNGNGADLVLVVAKTDPSQGAKGISLFGVETRELKGYSTGRKLVKIGTKSSDTSELSFEDVRVPASCLLGGVEGQGFYQLMQQLPQERLGIAVMAVAGMEKAVAETIAYVRERKAFGQALMDFQNTRFQLAECKTEAHIARVFLDDCIARHLRGELDSATVSMAKWWCTQKQCEVTDACLQLFGGYGYIWEYPIARLYADARVMKIFGGANELMKELVARSF